MIGFKFDERNGRGMERTRHRVLFLAVLTFGLLLALSFTKEGLSFDGLLGTLSLLPLVSLFAGAVLFLLYMVGFYIRLFRSAPFQSWHELMPEGLKSEGASAPRYALGLALSTLLFFLAFLVYFGIMAVFFYLAGEPFSSDVSSLLVAAFASVVALHFAGSLLPEDPQKFGDLVYEFLLPFGIIAGFMILNYLGQPSPLRWLWDQFVLHLKEIITLFIVYLWLDQFVPILRKALSPIRLRLSGPRSAWQPNVGTDPDNKPNQ